MSWSVSRNVKCKLVVLRRGDKFRQKIVASFFENMRQVVVEVIEREYLSDRNKTPYFDVVKAMASVTGVYERLRTVDLLSTLDPQAVVKLLQKVRAIGEFDYIWAIL